MKEYSKLELVIEWVRINEVEVQDPQGFVQQKKALFFHFYPSSQLGNEIKKLF